MSAEQHRISTEGHIGGAQFLRIQIKNRWSSVDEWLINQSCSRRQHIPSYNIRLNALEYQNFQDKISGSVENVENIQIFKTVSERFVEVFRETITENPSVAVTEELESCIGCMVNTANITLVRSCQSYEEGGNTVTQLQTISNNQIMCQVSKPVSTVIVDQCGVSTAWQSGENQSHKDHCLSMLKFYVAKVCFTAGSK